MSKDGEFSIHEVFYREDGSVEGYTETAVGPHAASVEELAKVLVLYTGALEKAVLPYG